MKLYSDFNAETGQSTVTIQNKYGIYTGTAQVHPDDLDYVSRYAGCRIAELRAEIKILKDEIQRDKIALSALQTLDKELRSYYAEDYNLKIQRHIYKQIKYYTNEINTIKTEIKEIEELIQKRIDIRTDIISRAKKAKEN